MAGSTGRHATDSRRGANYPWPVIDLHLVRSDPIAVAAALARRGLSGDEVERVAELDVVHRALLQRQEAAPLGGQVASRRRWGPARKAGDAERASALADQSRTVGDEEREAGRRGRGGRSGASRRDAGAAQPALADAPDGARARGQRRGAAVVARDREGGAGARPTPSTSGSPTGTSASSSASSTWSGAPASPARCSRSTAELGARLLRALGAFALDAHGDAYEEIRPPDLRPDRDADLDRPPARSSPTRPTSWSATTSGPSPPQRCR